LWLRASAGLVVPGGIGGSEDGAVMLASAGERGGGDLAWLPPATRWRVCSSALGEVGGLWVGSEAATFCIRPAVERGCLRVRDPAQQGERATHQCSLVSIELALERLG
jgi:hypothetical protein